ncbi:DUF2937 family protein [Nitratireductor sp. ZSWI3]|uniref:DUF2937 family protein n=1 Tax=Nitratireductor sp. ZSWI3 TaxID=2966359 RepID=UPI00214F68C3|nr:DUF2937 family protein [Nitratireductor sp. ZSWI3]MCR4267890.1 DUF2937 family protein [Nitratireductor sp. ZSWI3]
MFGFGRIAALAVTLACGLATSQAPELAQQYRQRLNGAMQELEQVVAAFDADATNNKLTRDEVLKVYDASTVPVLRDRGRSMRAAFDRFDRLVRHAALFEDLSPVARPLALVRSPDTMVLKGTLADFEPAVPITPHGLIWTGVGLLFGFGLFKGLALLLRRRGPRVFVQRRPL